MAEMSAIPGFLTLHEVADLLGVCHSQVARDVRNGKIPATRLGQQALIPETLAKELAERRKRNPPKRGPKPKGENLN
jgi:excisionase family DNA binding protein